ncbi:hypothetical protein SAMN02927937_01316 [Paenimyroides aquimaris]|uniref:Helicase HerA central domain-containing protein n=1 Tax=Paenimyroides marinum TaxID=1159016 RepID=A0A1H6KMB5_9FLAO|nr:ATP-binding protein [Paenimyroides aquimaris]SEH76840.1 hypothetical protein SAMN02927937_01316 [Paenimyroides aquimaris]
MENQINKSKEVLRVGKVVSVRGRTIEVLVDKTKNNSHLLFEGQLVRNVSVGSYVKITKGFEQLVGKIESEFVVEDKTYSQSLYKKESDKVKRTLSISLVGYFETNSFEQGIKELPLIDNECFILTKLEYDRVHAFVKDGEDKINIGVLSSETSKEIELSVNSLFASHIGIFGNTGSGKSYSLASLYHSLFKKYEKNSGFKRNAKFLLIDFNGEYISENIKSDEEDLTIFNINKARFNLSTDSEGTLNKLPISSDTIKDHTFWSILLQATEKTQMPFIQSALSSLYLKDKLKSEEGLKDSIKSTIKLITTSITPNQEKNLVETFLDELQKFGLDLVITGIDTLKKYYSENLNFFAGKEDRRYYCTIEGQTYNSNKDEGFYENVISNKVDEYVKIEFKEIESNELLKIKLIFNFHYYYVIQKGYYHKEHIGHIIGRLDNRLKDLNKLVKIDSEPFFDKTLSIISLKNVNVQMRKLIPLLICHQVYKEKKKNNRKDEYLNIIIDEAHNILSTNSVRESEIWKDYRLETFEEIIKEGRKFGTFLTLASQRPSDISSTIISQLHNYFLHRLINNKDIEAIEKTVSYLDKISFESLPILPTGTCIIAGLAAKLPVVVKMSPLDEEFQPNSQTIELTKYWGNIEEKESNKEIEDLETLNEEDDDLPF